MARATYKGTLKVGLVTCPVGVYKAAKEDKVELNWIHSGKCGGRVVYGTKVCTVCDAEVAMPGKGYEFEKGHTAEVDLAELEALKMASEKIIKVVCFTPMKDIPAVAYKGKLQYLGQTKNFEDVYSLLVEILTKKKLAGIAQVTVRGRDYPVVVMAVDGILMMDELFTTAEIAERRPEVSKVKVDREMKELGEALVSGMMDEFHHELVGSEYEDSIKKVVNEAINGKPKRAGKAKKKETPKSSSMDQLRASINAI